MIDPKIQENLKTSLDLALKKMDISLDELKQSQLIAYLGLLYKWNKTYNLTAVRDPEEMLIRHLVDSLSIVPYVTAKKVLDVGTGPGLPGIPLAIVYPEKQFSLLDSNSKKTRFLTQASIELGLKNVLAHHARIEKIEFPKPFEQIVSRAFASLDKMVDLCQHHLSDGGQFLAMKGLDPLDEKQEMDAQFQQTQCVNLNVPGCEGQRHLIIIERTL